MPATETFEISQTLKERPFEENQRRHWQEIVDGMHNNLMLSLISKGFVSKTIEPTNKAGEFQVTLKVKAVKDA